MKLHKLVRQMVVHWTFGPGAASLTEEELQEHKRKFLEAYLEGKYEVVDKIGDSNMT